MTIAKKALIVSLNGKCFTESIPCQAHSTANTSGYQEKVYLDISEITFKVRLGTEYP